MYSITCIQRSPKGSKKVVSYSRWSLKCRCHLVDLRKDVASKQWSLKAGGCLIQVVSNKGLTVLTLETWRSLLKHCTLCPKQKHLTHSSTEFAPKLKNGGSQGPF